MRPDHPGDPRPGCRVLGTGPRCVCGCPTPPGWSITSTPSSWLTRRSTTSVDASNKTPSGIEATKTTPLYRIRRALLVADERPSTERFDWIRAMLTPKAKLVPHGSPRNTFAASTPQSTKPTPADSSSPSGSTAPTPTSPNSPASLEPWTDGRTRSSPTTAPVGPPTDASRTSTCSPRRSAATATASPTTTTIDAASSAASDFNGLPSPPAESEAANHAQSRRDSITGTTTSKPPSSSASPSSSPGRRQARVARPITIGAGMTDGQIQPCWPWRRTLTLARCRDARRADSTAGASHE